MQKAQSEIEPFHLKYKITQLTYYFNIKVSVKPWGGLTPKGASHRTVTDPVLFATPRSPPMSGERVGNRKCNIN